MKLVVFDTNVLLEDPSVIEQYISEGYKVILPSSVLEEVDGLKKSNDDIGYKARGANRVIRDNRKNIKFEIKDIYNDMPDGWDKDKRDNKIVLCARDNNSLLVSNDVNVIIKAECVGVECYGIDEDKKDDEIYKGYKEVEFNDIQLSEFYTNINAKDYDLLINEYMLIKHNGKIVDKYKYNKDGLKKTTRKNMESIMFGKLKPKDEYQELVIDSLINEQFTAITGKQGSGKSLLSLMYCSWALEKGMYDTIVILFNPTKIRGSNTMGFYKGDIISKAKQESIGNILNSKFGDATIVDNLIAQNKIKLVPMSDCRGMEVTDNQILYITEAQNTTIDLMKICLGRVSSGAKIIIEGDPNLQVDSSLYEGHNNGMLRMIDIFKGEDLFSFVELKNVHRSRIADIVDKM